MTTRNVSVSELINFKIHNCELSLELTQILYTAIKTLPNSPEYKTLEVKNILKFLKNIDLYLIKEKNQSAAYYKDNMIYFNVENILTEIKNIKPHQINPIIQTSINHEVTHLFQDIKTQYIQRFKFRSNKLKKKLQPTFFGKIFPINNNNWKREELFELINKIYLEGLAMYIEYIGKDVDLDQLQSNCKKIILQTKNNYLNYNQTNKVENNNLDKYSLGLLMSIIILQDTKLNLSFEQLSNVGFKQFIEYYEKSAQNQSYEILISYSSNKGIFDYQSLIKYWKQEKRELKNKNTKNISN